MCDPSKSFAYVTAFDMSSSQLQAETEHGGCIAGQHIGSRPHLRQRLPAPVLPNIFVRFTPVNMGLCLVYYCCEFCTAWFLRPCSVIFLSSMVWDPELQVKDRCSTTAGRYRMVRARSTRLLLVCGGLKPAMSSGYPKSLKCLSYEASDTQNLPKIMIQQHTSIIFHPCSIPICR